MVLKISWLKLSLISKSSTIDVWFSSLPANLIKESNQGSRKVLSKFVKKNANPLLRVLKNNPVFPNQPIS